MKHALFLILLVTRSFFITTTGQSPDYPVIFGKDWDKAQEFVNENGSWIKERLRIYDLDFCESVAVIFPELIRYSALRDKMEITLLKALYVNIGKEYANFSIGQFQMKPSFAEEIAGSLDGLGSRRLKRLLEQPGDFESERDYRSHIVAELEYVRSQLDFLILFLKLCEKKYDTKSMTSQERVRFIATAYNYGLKTSREQIEMAVGKKFFSTSLVKAATWSYADISFTWYNSFCKSDTGNIK